MALVARSLALSLSALLAVMVMVIAVVESPVWRLV